MPVDIYDLLASQDVSATTLAQLDAAIKNTSIDRTNTKFWNGPITVYRTIESSRTYPHGIVIPEAGTIVTVSMAPGESATLQPPDSEVWHIKGIVGTGVGGTANATLSWTDGSSAVYIDLSSFTTGGTSQFLYATTPPITGSQPLTITNSLYLEFEETSGSAGISFAIAYHKVSL